MNAASSKPSATYEDLLKVPDHLVAEIIDGELHATPRPGLPHARAASVLAGTLGGPFDHGMGGPGGWWILFEPELHLADDILVPDLAGWRRERVPRIPAEAYMTVAPDWVCEVVAPSTEALDRVKKTAIYAREAVSHLWLINPTTRTLEVMALVWCPRNSWCTEGAAAPSRQGATTENIGPYLREEQRSRLGCSGGRMPSYFVDTTLESGRWVLLSTHADRGSIGAKPFDAMAFELGTLWSGTSEG